MKVFMQHPHRNEPPVEVDDTSDELVPLMLQGYQQVKSHEDVSDEEEN